MKVKENLLLSGYFWREENEDHKVPGILKIKQRGMVELEVVESLMGEKHIPDIFSEEERCFVVIGYIEDYGYCTLSGCFYRKKNINISGPPKKSLIHADKAFLGVGLRSEEMLFNALEFSVEGLDEWFGKSGIKVEYDSSFKTSYIHYVPMEEKLLWSKDGLKLFVTYQWTLPFFAKQREAKITHKTYLKLVNDEEKDIDFFTSALYKITNFLCFAVDNTLSVDSASVESNRIQIPGKDEAKRNFQIELYYQSLPYSEETPSIKEHNMLFGYSQIEINSQDILDKWWEAYERFSPSLNLYFSVRHGGYLFLESKFIALAQCVETYHRKVFPDSNAFSSQDEIAMEVVLRSCPKEYKEWLSDKLEMRKEMNLGRRVKEIIKEFGFYFGNKKDIKKLAWKITESRNYYTHYDDSKRYVAAAGIDLHILICKLEAVFQLHMLSIIGFTKEEVGEVVQNSKEIRYKIGLEGF